jgi:Polyketide cyclase / dehydrase and lipid transport
MQSTQSKLSQWAKQRKRGQESLRIPYRLSRMEPVPEPLRGQASVIVMAKPEAVYDLVSDISNMGRFSPETTGCEWKGKGGAKFKGRNRHGMMRWTTTCEVIAAERGREFAFRRPGPDKGTTWRYTFESVGGGTKVTESWYQEGVQPLVIRATIGLFLRGRDVQQAAETTLARIKVQAEKELSGIT